MLERVGALLASVIPVLAIVCAGLWKVFTWAMDRHDEALTTTTAAPIVQGQQIPESKEDWADRAYKGLERELDDERADHAHTINRHRACHATMREHGIPVPDDH
jgi:hypothetical protein